MSPPPIFRQLPLDVARAAAASENRFLLVDITATWCAPCQNMDRTTWLAPTIVAWIDEHAIAVQLDADAEPAVKTLAVHSLPTVILFRGEEELDRISGARSAAALLEWLELVRAGKTELDRLRATGCTDLHQRLQLAKALVEREQDDEAAEQFAWLWEHALEVQESWYGVKHSFLIAALEPLIKRSEGAHRRFEQFRAKAEDGLPDRSSFRDWVTLSTLLGHEDPIVDFVARLDEQGAAVLQLHRERRVLELLEERNQWALLGRVVSDPLAILRQEDEVAKTVLSTKPDYISDEDFAETRTFFANQMRRYAVNLCRAMAAVNRDDDVRRVVEEAKRLDPSVEMADAVASWA